jgi:hypothetical protein
MSRARKRIIMKRIIIRMNRSSLGVVSGPGWRGTKRRRAKRRRA